MGVLLKFIFIFIAVVYVLGLIGRLLLGRWVKRAQRDFQQDPQGSGFYRQYAFGRNRQRQQRPAKEGEIKITDAPTTEKKVSREIGEYVDFEEIK
ncbi:MAG: DUF4834 family protein [Rikenellaceae bacterium]|nr:DUF4834 family protein [Rikenellaceae bacterium]